MPNVFTLLEIMLITNELLTHYTHVYTKTLLFVTILLPMKIYLNICNSIKQKNHKLYIIFTIYNY